MSLMSTSSDEQPTQKLHLDRVASRLAFNRQLPIDEIDTELHPVVIEHVERTIQSASVANPDQQETLPLISLLSTVIQPAIECKATEQKISSHRAFLTDKKPRGPGSYTLLLWIPLFMFVVLFISVLGFRSAIAGWISHQVEPFQTPSR